MIRRLALLSLASLLFTTLAFGATDAKLVSMLDPSTRVVGEINATAIKSSPFGQYLLERSADANLTQFIASTGFDPRTQLQQALFASPGGASEHQGVMLVKGAFLPAQVFVYSAKKGATTSTYHGVKVAEFAAFQDKHGHTHGPAWLAFFGTSRAVFGSPEAVQHAIDRYVNNTAPDSALASKIAAMDGHYDAWRTSTVPGPEVALNLPKSSSNELVGLLATALQSVDSHSAGIKFTSAGASLSGQAVTASPQEALSLADRLRYMAGVAANQATQKQKPTLASYIQKVAVTTQGPDVNWSVQIPEAQLQQIAQQHAQAHAKRQNTK